MTITVCLLLIGSAHLFEAAPSPDVFSSLGKELKSDIAAVKQPVAETISYVGSSQCSNVKQIFGVAYEQLDGEKEPDLDQLKLEFRSNAVRSIYKINLAANEIPKSSDFDSRDKLVIFIHGFTDDPTKASFSNISESFLSKGGYNVLALDGSSLIHWLYLRSTTYVRFMGERLGEVLAAMLRKGVKADDILIVGHSLGSHIASFAGKTFQSVTGQKIGRISALDPAGPCFSHVEPELRLKKSDARYVDVIHTDAGVYGLKDAVGHADYYPNGGSKQPDCVFQTCSHSRAWLLYSETVLRPRAFPAVQCESYQKFKENHCTDGRTSYMGFQSAPETRGIFFLRTGDEPPYGLGEEGLRFEGETGTVNRAVDTGSSIAGKFANVTSQIFG